MRLEIQQIFIRRMNPNKVTALKGQGPVVIVVDNGWALDAYLMVFWREAPLLELWPQLVVLGALAAVFLTASRLLARRWETT